MFSARTASDTHFSRPRPARATRRAHQSLPHGPDEEHPPPPYHSPHVSSDEYSSDSANSDHHRSSDAKVISSTQHEASIGPVTADPTDDVALLVTRAGNALFASSRSPLSPRSPPELHLDPLDVSGLHTPPALSTTREHTAVPVTPQRLALLSEMNCELQERIDILNQQIEDEAANANAKLRRLEKEVVGLRAELEHTQQRNDELEEVARKEEEEDEQLAKRLRLERHEKLRLARERRLTHGMSPSTPGSTEPADFAPPVRRVIHHSQSTSITHPLEISPALAASSMPTMLSDSPVDDLQLMNIDPIPSDLSSHLLSQMNIKIAELEKATSILRDQKAQTAADVHKMVQDMQRSKGRPASASLSAAASAVSPVAPVFELPKPEAVGKVVEPEAPGPGPSRQNTMQRKRSGSLQKKPSLSGRRPKVGLGNKAMIALSGKGKGKMRAPITPLSFVPPTPSPPTNTEQLPSNSFLFPSNTRQPPGRTSLRLSSPDIFPRDDVFSSPMNEYPFFNTGDPNTSINSLPRLRTLKSELGVEFGGDWKADFEHKMFGSDFGLSDVDRDEADTDRDAIPTTGAVQLVDTAAMDALSAALDPLRIGEPRDSDEHILPLKSLRNAPVETFYLLDRAVVARPTMWISASAETLKLLTPNRAANRSSRGALQDDAWSMYPDEDVEEDEEQHDPGKSEVDVSLVRREQALNRLSQVRDRRISLYTDPSHLPSGHPRQESLVDPPGDTSLASTPTQYEPKDGEDDNEEEDHHDQEDGASSLVPRSSLVQFQRKVGEQEDTDNMSLATKLHNTSLQTMVQVWMSFQFVVVVVVFLYFTVKKGPTAIMAGGVGNAGPAKIRNTRGTMSSRRR